MAVKLDQNKQKQVATPFPVGETGIEELINQHEDEAATLVTNTPILITTTEVNNKSQELIESRKLPKSPGKTTSFPELEEWLKQITRPEQWNRLGGYIYRVIPVIIRQLSDPEAKNYIDVLTEEAVTYEDGGLIGYIKNNHGGGKYKFMLTDLDVKVARKEGAKGGPGSSPITEAILNIPITDDCMPKLNYKELDTNDKRNFGYIQLLKNTGVINDKGEKMQPAVVQDNAAEVAGVVAAQGDKALQMVKDMSKDQQNLLREVLSNGKKDNNDKGVTELLLEKMKQDDPNKQTQMMLTLITTIMGLIPKDKPASNDGANVQLEMMKFMMQQQQQAQEFQSKILMQVMELTNKRPESDSILDKIIAYKEVLPGLFGNTGSIAEPKSTTEMIIDKVSEVALPLIGLGSQLLQARGMQPIIPVTAGQAQEAVRQMTGPRPNVQPFVNNNPGPQLVPQIQAPQPITDGTMQEQPMQQQPQQPINEPDIITKLLISYGGLLITSIKSGTTGANLADQVITLGPMLNMDVYGLLVGAGKEKLLNTMKSLPEFWNATGKVFGDAHMEKLVEDFIEGPEDDDNEDEPIDDATGAEVK